MSEEACRGGDLYDDQLTERYLAHRHSGARSPNTVMEEPAFLEAIGDVQGLRVLDLGCGDGSTARLVLGAGAASYCGIDGSPSMIARARAAVVDQRATFEVADIEDVRPDRGGVDLIISRMALHYVTEVGMVFRRAREGLTGGGRLVFTVAHPVITSHENDPDGRRTSWTVDDYFVRGPRPRQWFGTTVTWWHRTIEDYVCLLLEAGFAVRGLSECEPAAHLLADDPPELARRRRVPVVLLLAAESS
jgi:SAM-dependent methyltransferase